MVGTGTTGLNIENEHGQGTRDLSGKLGGEPINFLRSLNYIRSISGYGLEEMDVGKKRVIYGQGRKVHKSGL